VPLVSLAGGPRVAKEKRTVRTDATIAQLWCMNGSTQVGPYGLPRWDVPHMGPRSPVRSCVVASYSPTVIWDLPIFLPHTVSIGLRGFSFVFLFLLFFGFSCFFFDDFFILFSYCFIFIFVIT
jgi:hypothetical protein